MNMQLPILARRTEIEALLRAHRVIVLCGETGSGKTTQLPQICHELGLTKSGILGHTQPRRLAARAVAARIAEEMGVPLGGLVGVKVRFQDTTGRGTKIKLMTDGLLLAELASDPMLSAYSCLIIDEAHERSLNIDFLLGYLQGLLGKRDDLKVIITSATIDPARFSEFFGGPALAPVIEVSGRMYPVEVRYRPGDSEDREDSVAAELIADGVEELLGPRGCGGDVLVFLPGEREIRTAGDAIRRRGVDAEILPLFSRLSSQEQDRIFHPGDRRRVILATNVAETSLTVPGIRGVVDSGLARQHRYDAAKKITKLPIEPISRASAAQRSGRCGRVAHGVAIRLYSEESFAQRPRFTEPEITRTNLAEVLLRTASLGLGELESFPFLDRPDAASITDARETLFELGALESAEPGAGLTAIGRQLSRLPLDPRIGRMLLAARDEACEEQVLVLAAVLSIQDPRERPMGRQEDAERAQLAFRDETSDFLTLLRVWEQFEHATRTMTAGGLRGWCRDRYLSMVRLREWRETYFQLREMLEDIEQQDREGAEKTPPITARPLADRIHRSLLTGLISSVACREGAEGSFDYRAVRGSTCSIFPGSVLFKKAPKWIMAAELVQTTRLYARTCARIDPVWIEELAGHMLRRQLSDKHLDTSSGVPSAWERVTMSGIVVVPRRLTAIADPALARLIFLRDGLAAGTVWTTGQEHDTQAAMHTLLSANHEQITHAAKAEAKLRRRGIMQSLDTLAAWFEQRLPPNVWNPLSLSRALEQDPSMADRLRLNLRDIITPEAQASLTSEAYPDEIVIDDEDGPVALPLTYAFAPGKDEDGLTVTVELSHLPLLTPARAEWLVPGLLESLVLGLLKLLPKPVRTTLETKGTLATIAHECAHVMEFGRSRPAEALAEALRVLYDVSVDPATMSAAALPALLRMRIAVVDAAATSEASSTKPLAVDRDLAALLKRLESKIARARSARVREAFDQDRLTSWSFGTLPRTVDSDDGSNRPLFPALLDRASHVSLALLDHEDDAIRETPLGIRRLFALLCGEEVRAHLEALPRFSEMTRWHGSLGTTAGLLDDLTLIVVDRAFLAGQSLPRTRAEFEERRELGWGRLTTIAREVGDIAAQILEPRSIVAKRLSGGTPRLWADSIADIREHAAYLFAEGFFAFTPWERLKSMPRYTLAMRERLLNLREDGSGVEKPALTQLAPYWKKLTAYIAAAMARAKSQASEDNSTSVEPLRRGKGGAPLPQARRSAPTVNLDAGAWAMRPGNLPPAVVEYRWALEEFRVSLFVPRLTARGDITPATLDAMWKKVATLPPSGKA